MKAVIFAGFVLLSSTAACTKMQTPDECVSMVNHNNDLMDKAEDAFFDSKCKASGMPKEVVEAAKKGRRTSSIETAKTTFCAEGKTLPKDATYDCIMKAASLEDLEKCGPATKGTLADFAEVKKSMEAACERAAAAGAQADDK